MAGDEKLLPFSGQSGNVRKKSDGPVGLWYYELSGLLSKDANLRYMLHIMMHKSEKERDVIMSTAEAVEKWCICIKSKENTPCTILVMDQYYPSNDSLAKLHRYDVKYIAGGNTGRFQDWTNFLTPYVTNVGKWKAIHNRLTNKTCVMYYQRNDTSGNKKNQKRQLVLSNVHRSRVKQRGEPKIVPVYDDYAKAYNVCDKFNQSLSKRYWPHKHDSKDCSGEYGQQDNFAFSVLLQNVRNVWLMVNKKEGKYISHKDFCIDLSDKLYHRAMLIM